MNQDKIKEYKQFLKSIVEILETKAVYADAILIDKDDLSVSKDKDSVNVDRKTDRGIKIRAFDGEQYIEYGTSSFDKQELTAKAQEIANNIVLKDKVKLTINTENLSTDFTCSPDIDAKSIPLADKIEFVKKLQTKIFDHDSSIINARVLYAEATEHKIFVNKYKQLYQKIDSCFVITVPFIQTKDGDVRYRYKSFFKEGYEVTKIDPKQIEDLLDLALKLKTAKKIKPGKYLCILTPHLSGLLAHESFGHGMESDTVYKDRAKAKDYIGKKIAAENVSIIDNPSLTARNGSYFFDDEGMVAKPTYLIKKGIVQDPITDSYSASRLNIKRSANGRMESFDHKTYARMSNTYFDAGTDDVDEMLASIKDGLYLHYSLGGMEDPKGWGVQIQGIVAETIKDGKLTGELFYELGMTGYLPTILNNIEKVGNILKVPGTGHCGKGHKEWVRVSEGGSHLLIKDVDLA